MAEYVDKKEVYAVACKGCIMAGDEYGTCYCTEPGCERLTLAFVSALAADVVDRAAFDQVMWERDTAMEQLKEHGIPFGGKADVVEVVRCKDCRNSMLWRKPADTVIGECLIRKMHSEDEVFCQVRADDFCSYGKRRNDNAR